MNHAIFSFRRLGSGLALCARCLALGIASMAGGQALAQDAVRAPCPDGPAPRISVTVDVADFVYEHSRSVSDLGRMQSASPTTSGHDVTKLLGLTLQQFMIGGNTTQLLTLARKDGSACVGLTDGTIQFRLSTAIFVARELAPDSCLYSQVLAHEERHAKVGRRLYTEFAAKVQAGLAEALQQSPFLEVQDSSTATAVTQARLQDIIEPLFRDFRSVYRKRQAIIDTSGEYARVDGACPGERARALGQ